MSIGTITFKDSSGSAKNLNVIDTGSGGPYVPLHVIGDATGTPISPATSAKQDSLLALFPSSIGQKVTSNSLSIVLASNHDPVVTSPSVDQDPIFDNANGTKTSVTTSATVITPPTGCKYVRISSDIDVFVNTSGSAAVDNGTSIRIIANSPEVIPVTAAIAVTALSSSGTATVRCTPLKVR